MTLIVFAKAPRPGHVKTRLIPLLGEWGAARLQAQLIESTVERALRARFRRIELHCTPNLHHLLLRRLAKQHAIGLFPQRGADLGARMQQAFARALRHARAVVLVGTDCPQLTPADLRAAQRALLGGAQAVFAPAEDGGYVLVGLRRVSERLFSGIEWGGPTVMRETRERLQHLGWRWRELRTLWDVDRPEDYARLRRRGAGRLARRAR